MKKVRIFRAWFSRARGKVQRGVTCVLCPVLVGQRRQEEGWKIVMHDPSYPFPCPSHGFCLYLCHDLVYDVEVLYEEHKSHGWIQEQVDGEGSCQGLRQVQRLEKGSKVSPWSSAARCWIWRGVRDVRDNIRSDSGRGVGQERLERRGVEEEGRGQ